MNEFLRKVLYLPEQRSTVAQEIDWLHYFVILTTMAGTVAVALAVLYFLIRYRRSGGKGVNRPPDERPHHSRGGLPVWFEAVVIAGLLGLFVLWWVIGFWQFVRLREVPEDSIEIYVTGKKWMWSFAYPGGGISNAVLYVPEDRPVKLVLTSRDVIHSFYVPAFRVKQDAVPGRMTTMWFEATDPGTYQALCAEYCGTSHSTMRARVVVLGQGEYEARVASLGQIGDRVQLGELERSERVAPLPGEPDLGPEDRMSMVRVGEQVANRYGCLRCHTVDGTPHIGPTWARAYGSEVILESGETVIVDEAYLTESMMDPLAKIHRGYPPVMPPYLGLLDASETGAIVEYIRSLRNVPDAFAPSPLPLLDRGQLELVFPPEPERLPGLTPELTPPGAEAPPPSDNQEESP